MRIVFITNQYLPTFGGVEIYVNQIAKQLVLKGHDVSVLTNKLVRGVPLSSLPRYEELDGIKIIRSWTVPVNIGKGWPSISPSFPQDFMNIRPDIVHINGLWPYYITNTALLLSKAAKIKTVFTPHYNPFRKTKVRYLDRSIHLKVLRLADYIIAITATEKAFYDRIGIVKSSLVPNPVELVDPRAETTGEIKSKWDLGQRVLLSVGRITASKRFRLAIDLLERLSHTVDDLQLVIVGEDWGEASNLRKHAKEMGVSKKVIVVEDANDDELHAFYSLSAIVLITSTYEAFGRTIVEAWAHSKPVVAFSNPGTVDTLASNVGGVLVNSFDEFVDTVSQLISSPDTLARLGADGNLIARSKYTSKLIANDVERIYCSLLK